MSRPKRKRVSYRKMVRRIERAIHEIRNKPSGIGLYLTEEMASGWKIGRIAATNRIERAIKNEP